MTMYLSCKAIGFHKDMVYIKQRIQYRLRKIFNIGGSTAMQSEETERLCKVFTGVQGAGPLGGLQGGSTPLPKKILYFAS